MNPRYDEFDDSVRHIGLHAAHCYLLHTPLGDDRLLLQLDGPDPAASLAVLGDSPEPFDVWFTQRLRQLTGVALSHLPPELIAEPLVDYEAHAWVDE
jgi:hypothetical protein